MSIVSQSEFAAIIDRRRAERAQRNRRGRETERTRAIRAIEPGTYRDFAVADAFEAASLRGSAYYVLGKGEAWVEQLSHRTVRVFRQGEAMTLTQWRNSLGLSQGKLARQLGCSQSALGRWELGQKQPNDEYKAALDVLGYSSTNWGRVTE